jgi:hypothetical protein
MRKLLLTAAALAAVSASPALAGQPVIATPAGTAKLSTVLYEVDYATAGPLQQGSGFVGQADTIVSIGLPLKSAGKECNIQVAWYDWNGALAGVSGPFGLTPGVTFEFTTSINVGNPVEYAPFQENVFSDNKAPFEGYAQILTDTSCASTQKLRVDAEFVTLSMPASGGEAVGIRYKSINVTNVKGATGY